MRRYHYLTPVLGGPGAPRFPVTDELQLIGRSEKAHISLLEPTVSRRHATVQTKEGKICLADLGSKHGTFVNSRRISNTELRVGDIVVFGLSLVLRLEESPEPVPAQDAMTLPVDTPTLLDPLEHLTVADPPPRGSRSTLRQPTGLGLLAPEEKTAVHVDASAVCEAMLPEAHVRLSELRADLRRLVDEGIDETDPYPILASVESVLATLNHIMQALGSEEEVSPSVVKLREVVERVVKRVGPAYESRGVRFMSDVERGFRVLCDARRLEGALSLLLRCAGQASPEQSPVEMMATTAGGDRVRLSISHLGREYPADILRRSHRDPDDVLARDMNEAARLVHGMGGEISVESRAGVGSTVRLTLPMPARNPQR